MFNYPEEIISIIFSHVKDKEGILKLRILNKKYYSIYKNFKDNENKEYFFYPNQYLIKFNNTKYKEVIFKGLGYYTYKHYNNNILVNEINVNLFKIEKKTYHNYGLKKKIINMITNDISEEEQIFPLDYPCLIM